MAPKIIADHERLFFVVRSFYRGRFDQVPIYTCEEGDYARLRLVRDCILVLHQFSTGNMEYGGRNLRSAFIELEEVLMVKHPWTLCYLCALSLDFMRVELYDIAIMMFIHVHALIERSQGYHNTLGKFVIHLDL